MLFFSFFPNLEVSVSLIIRVTAVFGEIPRRESNFMYVPTQHEFKIQFPALFIQPDWLIRSFPSNLETISQPLFELFLKVCLSKLGKYLTVIPRTRVVHELMSNEARSIPLRILTPILVVFWSCFLKKSHKFCLGRLDQTRRYLELLYT